MGGIRGEPYKKQKTYKRYRSTEHFTDRPMFKGEHRAQKKLSAEGKLQFVKNQLDRLRAPVEY